MVLPDNIEYLKERLSICQIHAAELVSKNSGSPSELLESLRSDLLTIKDLRVQAEVLVDKGSYILRECDKLPGIAFEYKLDISDAIIQKKIDREQLLEFEKMIEETIKILNTEIYRYSQTEQIEQRELEKGEITPAKINPRVPKKPTYRARWKAIYHIVVADWKRGTSIEKLVENMQRLHRDLSVSVDTMSDILRAGDAGLLTS